MAKRPNNPSTELQRVESIPEQYAPALVSLAGAGTETITQEDMQIPFIRIVQAMSPVRQKGRSEYIPGIEEGDFFNTVTGEVWKGETGIDFIPIRFRRRYTEWWPRNSDKKGLVADHGSNDAIMLRATRTDTGKLMTPEGTEVVQAAEYLVLVVDVQAGAWSPAVISLTGTQLKKARQLNTRIASRTIMIDGKPVRAPMFYSLWHAHSVPESNDSGAWMGWRFDEVSPVLAIPGIGPILFEEATALYNRGDAIKTAPLADVEEA